MSLIHTCSPDRQHSPSQSNEHNSQGSGEEEIRVTRLKSVKMGKGRKARAKQRPGTPANDEKHRVQTQRDKAILPSGEEKRARARATPTHSAGASTRLTDQIWRARCQKRVARAARTALDPPALTGKSPAAAIEKDPSRATKQWHPRHPRPQNGEQRVQVRRARIRRRTLRCHNDLQLHQARALQASSAVIVRWAPLSSCPSTSLISTVRTRLAR